MPDSEHFHEDMFSCDVSFSDSFEVDSEFKSDWQKIYDQKNVKGKKQAAATIVKNKDTQNQQTVENKEKVGARSRIIKRVVSFILVLTVFYGIAVYSNIPFLAKWRTIYIETAMSTLHHHWLATMFIPQSVIEKVMLESSELEKLQLGLSSHWSGISFSKKNLYLPWEKVKSKFFDVYGEIDQQSFNDYIEQHPDEVIDEDGFLMIDKAGLKDGGTSIQTAYGDQVLAIDTKNAITIVKVTGDGYVGRLAIVKDPSRVGIGLSENFDQKGARMENIAKYNDAVLAINASGFDDPNGEGNGGNAYGLVISDGEVLKEAQGDTYKTIGLDYNNKLYIGNYESMSEFRDAVEFKPALIIDGQLLVSGSDGWGIQPRSAVGQTKDGDFLLLIVDGRAPGYSIGCTVGELARIMDRYGAYQACNLDGGSSSLMYYNGREISKPSAADKTKGRSVPNGFVVYNTAQ